MTTLRPSLIQRFYGSNQTATVGFAPGAWLLIREESPHSLVSDLTAAVGSEASICELTAAYGQPVFELAVPRSLFQSLRRALEKEVLYRHDGRPWQPFSM